MREICTSGSVRGEGGNILTYSASCTHETLEGSSIAVACCIVNNGGRETYEVQRDLHGFSSGGLATIDHLDDPNLFLMLEPDAIGHPALLAQSKRHFRWLRCWGRVHP